VDCLNGQSICGYEEGSVIIHTMKNILFDLDGTLLPMNEDEFTRYYFGLLCRKMAPYGLDSKTLVDNIWAGTAKMISNDGYCTNEEAFWRFFTPAMGIDREKYEPLFKEFYRDEFNIAIKATQPTQLAKKVIDACLDKGYDIYLATNPFFPSEGTLNRIRWAGMDKDAFKYITTYENSSFCKPNLDYYRELMEKFSIDPTESMMVGNDVEEDMIASKLGFKTCLITDCLLNRKKLPIEADWQGSLAEFLEFIKNTDVI